MKTYKVGGYVRDKLLGIDNNDIDHVVVGSCHEEMVNLGYQQVGKDFPVYLHPETKEEYALARQERKIKPGYNGFTCVTDNVTLKQDLSRRDLTINAMAEDEHGNIIDYFGGQQDLKDKWIRHTSSAFAEDPLRVLRVCRFAARLGFDIHPETIKLIKTLVDSGELSYLTPERVWIETEKALKLKDSWLYFEVMINCESLEIVYPELHNLIGKTQPIKYHPEGNAWSHSSYTLMKAKDESPIVKFAALYHDIGKGVTPSEMLPHHYGHDKEGIEVFNNIKLPIPNEYKDLALLTIKYHMKMKYVFEMKSKRIVKFFRQLDAFRKPQRLLDFIKVCELDNTAKENGEFVIKCLHDIMKIKYNFTGMNSEQIKQCVHRERIKVVAKVKSNL